MFVVSGAAGIGKTKALCNYVYENYLERGVLVCRDTTKMLNKLHNWGYKGIKVVDYDEFLNMSAKERCNHLYYIDNVNRFMSYAGVDGWTYNVPDEKLSVEKE